MNIVMFIIFLMTDLAMVGIFAFVYSGKEQYQEGMILGVHIPELEIKNQEVVEIGIRYKRALKKFNLWNLLVGIVLCFLCFWNIAWFVVIWLIWLLFYIVWGMHVINGYHRQMYALKRKHSWIMEGSSHLVHIDTALSAMSNKLPISIWWHSIIAIAGVLMVFFSMSRGFYTAKVLSWILLGSLLFVIAFIWCFHIWIVSRANIVYSMDSAINEKLNRVEKRTWSVILLFTNVLNLIGMGYLTARIAVENWLGAKEYLIYTIIQMIPAFVMIAGVMYIYARRKEILSMDTEAVIVDDDDYWKNGWYNNPNDSKLWVQDRMCSTNYSMNMAKPMAKVFMGGTAALIAAVTIGVMIIVSWLGNTKIQFAIDGSQVSIHAAWYHTEFDANDIRSITMLEAMPEDNFVRTNGADMENMHIGYYDGKNTGKCIMFIYQKDTAVLKIQLDDRLIFVNSRDAEQVKEWYEKLTSFQ